MAELNTHGACDSPNGNGTLYWYIPKRQNRRTACDVVLQKHENRHLSYMNKWTIPTCYGLENFAMWSRWKGELWGLCLIPLNQEWGGNNHFHGNWIVYPLDSVNTTQGLWYASPSVADNTQPLGFTFSSCGLACPTCILCWRATWAAKHLSWYHRQGTEGSPGALW